MIEAQMSHRRRATAGPQPKFAARAVVVEPRALPTRPGRRRPLLLFLFLGGALVTPSGSESTAPRTVRPPHAEERDMLMRDDSGCVEPEAASNDCEPVL